MEFKEQVNWLAGFCFYVCAQPWCIRWKFSNIPQNTQPHGRSWLGKVPGLASSLTVLRYRDQISNPVATHMDTEVLSEVCMPRLWSKSPSKPAKKNKDPTLESSGLDSCPLITYSIVSNAILFTRGRRYITDVCFFSPPWPIPTHLLGLIFYP